MVNELKDRRFKRGTTSIFFYKICIRNSLVKSLTLKGINRSKLKKRLPPLITN